MIRSKRQKTGLSARFGSVNLLINGAGETTRMRSLPVRRMKRMSRAHHFLIWTKRDFPAYFQATLLGAFLASQVFGKDLLKAEYPAIINVSSMSAYTPMTKVPAYSAAKAAVQNFTMWMAVHFAKKGCG
ncbi:SDR family NAD(P)-dependent oxidoreductase [Bacillus velezensis]